jgi:MFS transporter, DHA2 family, multidrug resistance protein
MGIGVGLAGTPASHSLTGSVPVRRVGMASGTADLQRDLGGAIMQSIFGALLTAGYASAAGSLVPSSVNSNVESELTKSFSSAANTAAAYPDYASQIIAGARQSFLDGAKWAYFAGVIAVLVGGVLVFWFFPRHEREVALLAQYQDDDDAD